MYPTGPVPFGTVATRKLIFAALVCGLAILLAGGVWLVSSSSDDDSSNGDLLVVGQKATVGDIEATVADGQATETDAVLVVDMSVVADGPSEITDLATGWSLLSPTGAAVTMVLGGELTTIEPCETATATPGAPTRCVLAFDLTEPVGSLIGFTAVYERNGERAAWLVQ
jgi:hypothetical protein